MIHRPARAGGTVPRHLALLAGLLVLAGCTGPSGTDQVPDERVPPPLTPTGVAGLEPELDVVDWGGSGDQLAVVVRNTTHRTIVEADLVVQGTDGAGRVVTVRPDAPRDPCCTVLSLPPDEQYGLFARIDRSVDELADVTVRVRRVRLATPDPDRRADISASRLERTADDAVVVARVTGVGDIGPVVTAQAVLVDPDDRPVGLISGRFYCFDRGRQSQVRMELMRTVPPGTRIGQVMAYPLPRDVPSDAADTCTRRGDR